MEKGKGKWQEVIKLLFFAVVLSCHSMAMADNVWVLVYQNVNGDTKELLMENVGSLVAVDDASDFSIISNVGDILAEGVIKVSFEQKEPTAISHTVQPNKMLSRTVDNNITIIGLTGEISIFDIAGVLQVKVAATGSETIINIGHLPTGVYVVKCGKQSFKFNKK